MDSPGGCQPDNVWIELLEPDNDSKQHKGHIKFHPNSNLLWFDHLCREINKVDTHAK